VPKPGKNSPRARIAPAKQLKNNNDPDGRCDNDGTLRQPGHLSFAIKDRRPFSREFSPAFDYP
jgi:hypothetical protein